MKQTRVSALWFWQPAQHDKGDVLFQLQVWWSNQEAKPSHQRTRTILWWRGMGLARMYPHSLLTATHLPLTACFSYGYSGGWDGPSADSSFHILCALTCKSHGPHRLPLAACLLGLQWVAGSMTAQLCWITSQSKPRISAAFKLVQRDQGNLDRLKYVHSTLNRISSLSFFQKCGGLLYQDYVSPEIVCQSRIA